MIADLWSETYEPSFNEDRWLKEDERLSEYFCKTEQRWSPDVFLKSDYDRNGAFITTSYFSQGAIEFAKNYPHSDIVLIDGKKLTELMIEYNLGVSVEKDIYIKRIDSDYFDL